MKAKLDNAPHSGSGDSENTGCRKLSPDEKLAWLRLVRTPNIGAVTFWGLIEHFGSATAAIEALPGFVRQSNRASAAKIVPVQVAQTEMEKAAEAGMMLIAHREQGYPPLLSEVEMPPPLIYLRGGTALWRYPPIAIVGSRNASAASMKFAGLLAAELSGAGLRVISGLARGIDGAAHRGALPWGTAAILPGGLDMIYPPEHALLAGQIIENGLIVSESSPGFVARAQDFPRRNRIISGCSLGVVVIEAAERSGSLITARLALEQNREVFAAPGHALDARAAGTNSLLKQGAIFTTSADDVIQGLQAALASWLTRTGPDCHYFARCQDHDAANVSEPPIADDPTTETRTFPADIGDAAAEILNALSLSPIGVDDLAQMTGIPVRKINAALISLDLEGLIDRSMPGIITRIP